MKYRKVKDNNRKTGNNRQNCAFYSNIDGTKPASVLPVVVESQTAADTAESTATTAVTISTEGSTESETSEVMNDSVSSNEQWEQQEEEDLQEDDDISKLRLVSIMK